jgi:hypothetical protein
MRLSTALIRNNYRVRLATLDVDGTAGEIYATTGKGFTSDVDIFVKLKGHKAIKATVLDESVNVYDLPDYIDESIDLSFVTNWAYPLEPHIPQEPGQ